MLHFYHVDMFEALHDKTIKMTVPEKVRLISLCIQWVYSVFAQTAQSLP